MIKKILCKYFSEDGDNERVTVGSFLWRFMMYSILILSIVASYTTINEAFTPEIEKMSMWGTFGLFGISIVFLILFWYASYMFTKISSIEITKCERKQ